jgi:hypothetical protein
MLITAAFLLLVAIMLGVANLINLLQKKRRSKTVVVLHGSMAIIAWLLVCLHMITTGYSTILLISFVTLSLTLLGGLILLSFRSKHQSPPHVSCHLSPDICHYKLNPFSSQYIALIFSAVALVCVIVAGTPKNIFARLSGVVFLMSRMCMINS